MNETFNDCVYILENIAYILGITYEEINVWIFCIIWPILTIWLAYMAFGKKIKRKIIF
jgi:hypothetical protein